MSPPLQAPALNAHAKYSASLCSVGLRRRPHSWEWQPPYIDVGASEDGADCVAPVIPKPPTHIRLPLPETQTLPCLCLCSPRIIAARSTLRATATVISMFGTQARACNCLHGQACTMHAPCMIFFVALMAVCQPTLTAMPGGALGARHRHPHRSVDHQAGAPPPARPRALLPAWRCANARRSRRCWRRARSRWRSTASCRRRAAS